MGTGHFASVLSSLILASIEQKIVTNVFWFSNILDISFYGYKQNKWTLSACISITWILIQAFNIKLALSEVAGAGANIYWCPKFVSRQIFVCLNFYFLVFIVYKWKIFLSLVRQEEKEMKIPHHFIFTYITWTNFE